MSEILQPVGDGVTDDTKAVQAILDRRLKKYLLITDEQVETVCRELFGDTASEALYLQVRQALKKAFENEK